MANVVETTFYVSFKNPLRRYCFGQVNEALLYILSFLNPKEWLSAVVSATGSNAIKYNEENGKIDVLVGTRKENIIIEIEDNGIGIPKEKVKYIFNRYERVQTSEARYKEGSGLGLNIVKEIINKFNGSVKIESEESIGTKITIIIPKIEYNEELYEDYSDGFNFKNDIIQKVDLEMSDIFFYKKIMVNIYKCYFVVYTIFIVAKRKVLWLLSSIGFIIIKAKGVMLLNVVIGGCSVNEQIW